MTSQTEKPNVFSVKKFLTWNFSGGINMNAYIENTGYRVNTKHEEAVSAPRFGDGFISFVCAIIGMLACPTAIKLEKISLSFILFIGFFGVVGGIETGAISMLLGIIICGAISLCEYATLKSLTERTEKTEK